MNKKQIIFSFIANFISIGITQRTYNCIQTGSGLCETGTPETGINPRILPSERECPPGFGACDEVRCGVTGIQQTGDYGPATNGAFPWQAYLVNAATGDYAGSGVLIDQYHVVTAAHKVANLTSVTVIMGVHNINDMTNTQTSPVQTIVLHESYNNTVLKNDIALLRLRTPINMRSSITTACLPSEGVSFVGQNCLVSGWGQTSFNIDDAPKQSKRFVRLPIVTSSSCKTALAAVGTDVSLYLDDFEEREICAGGVYDRDACTRDGGSPLVCANNGVYFVAGLVIWGKNCGLANVPGVYVGIPAYNDWIECAKLCVLDNELCVICPADIR